MTSSFLSPRPPLTRCFIPPLKASAHASFLHYIRIVPEYPSHFYTLALHYHIHYARLNYYQETLSSAIFMCSNLFFRTFPPTSMLAGLVQTFCLIVFHDLMDSAPFLELSHHVA